MKLEQLQIHKQSLHYTSKIALIENRTQNALGVLAEVTDQRKEEIKKFVTDEARVNSDNDGEK